MKKSVAVISMLVYLVLTVGLTLNMRFCNDSLASVQIGERPTHCCCGVSPEQLSCCELERYFVQLDIDQLHASQLLSLSHVVLNLPAFVEEMRLKISEKTHQTLFEYTDKPPPKARPLWLMHCTFTYYG